MPNPPLRTLSKSDFKAARTCPTKLYYRELRYPSILDHDPYLAMLAEGGYMVEWLARLRYPDGIPLEHGPDPVADARVTARFLEQPRVTLFEAALLSGQKYARVDILQKDGDAFRLIEIKAKSFDPTENHERLLAGEPSVFLSRNGRSVLSKWDKYIADAAFQVLVLRELYSGATIRPFLCFVDTSKRTRIDGLPRWFSIERRTRRDGRQTVHRVHFTGDADRVRQDNLVIEVDVSAEVELLLDDVRRQAAEFEDSLRHPLRRLRSPLGAACKRCEYRLETSESDTGVTTTSSASDPMFHGFDECWGEMTTVRPLVLDLYRASESIVSYMVKTGRPALTEVPQSLLLKRDGTLGTFGQRQLVQIEHTRSGRPWVSDGLARVLGDVEYPLHFIDFEATRSIIPPHAGMRPYGLIAFQWSCHTVDAPGATPRHHDWINTEDLWPNAEFAHTLREHIGTNGTVLAWARFERDTLRTVLDELDVFGHGDPELEAWLRWLTEKGRIVDMNQVTLDHFFHPDMGGSTSIKVVLDALWKSDPSMRARFHEITGHEGDPTRDPYAALPPIVINGKPRQVAEGTGAIRAYEAMMWGVERDDPASKQAWGELLKQYCRLDTLAMVLIWEHWQRVVGEAFGPGTEH